MPQGITRFEGGFACLACGNRFKDKSHARRHYKNLHVPQPKASCHVCFKVFKTPHYRNQHLGKVHGITQKMLKGSSGVPDITEPEDYLIVDPPPNLVIKEEPEN